MEAYDANSTSLVFTLLMCFFSFVLPRRYVVFPILVLTCYITLGQSLLIGSFHFYMLRIMILASWIRILIRGEARSLKWTRIDKAIILWVVISVIIYVWREQSQQALINQSGFVFDVLGIYFIFRFFIRDYGDLVRACKMLAVIIVPLAVAMLVERATGKNLFSIFGGVSEYSTVRDGRLRAQGAFPHPILAGIFGATTFYLLSGLWLQDGNGRKLGLAGMVSAFIVTVTSASSGPLLAFCFGLLALATWKYRNRMRAVRWGIVLSLVLLIIVMKAPVWYLFDRVSEYTGGTGWHRSELINSFLAHFDEWCLIGTSYTAHWMPYVLPTNPNMVDITNNYIQIAVNGGLASLFLFISLIVSCFKSLGKSMRRLGREENAVRMFLWILGTTLLAHLVSFLDIEYSGPSQMVVLWYMLLAMISCITGQILLQPQIQDSASMDGYRAPVIQQRI